MSQTDDAYRKKQDKRDEKRLAKHRAQDDRRGPPSRDLLTERAADAIRNDCPKTALEALRQGADVNGYLNFKYYGNDMLMPLVMGAAWHDQHDVLKELLKRGADRTACAVETGETSKISIQLLPWLARYGYLGSLRLVLENGSEGLQEQLDKALVSVFDSSYHKEGMLRLLLDNGAKSHEKALRRAEKMHSTEDLQKILRASAAEQGVPLPPPGGPILAEKESAIMDVLDAATETQRQALLARLREKYAADFEAAAKAAEATQTRLVKKTKNTLNM